AAVVHELDGFAPAGVREKDERVAPFCLQAEGDLGALPFVGPADALPLHELARLRLEDLHVETTSLGPEVNRAADVGVARRSDDPPVRKAVEGRKRLVDLLGRTLHAHSMKNVR